MGTIIIIGNDNHHEAPSIIVSPFEHLSKNRTSARGGGEREREEKGGYEIRAKPDTGWSLIIRLQYGDASQVITNGVVTSIDNTRDNGGRSLRNTDCRQLAMHLASLSIIDDDRGNNVERS